MIEEQYEPPEVYYHIIFADNTFDRLSVSEATKVFQALKNDERLVEFESLHGAQVVAQTKYIVMLGRLTTETREHDRRFSRWLRKEEKEDWVLKEGEDG